MQIKKDIKIFWQHLQKYKKKVYFIVILAVIVSAISAVIPYIYGRLVDIAIGGATKVGLILAILALWLFLTLISNWGNRYIDRESMNVAIKSSNDFLLKLSHHINQLPVGFHKEKRIGEILQRIGRAADYFEMIINQAIFDIAPGILRVVVALGILTFVEWRLSVAIFVIVGLYIFATVLKTKPIMKSQKKLHRSYEKGYGDLYNSTFNIPVVKASIAEPIERRKNTKNFKEIAKRMGLLMRVWVTMGAWQQTIFGFGFVFIFALGIFLLRSDAITAGELVMFIGYTSLVYQPVAQLAHSYRFIKRGMVTINRALSLFKIKTESYEKGLKLKAVMVVN